MHKLLLTKAGAMRLLGPCEDTIREHEILEREDFPAPVYVGTSKRTGKDKYMYRRTDIEKFVAGMDTRSPEERMLEELMGKCYED